MIGRVVISGKHFINPIFLKWEKWNKSYYNYLSFQKKINEYDNCTESCFDKFEYNGKCYDNCTNGFYMENNISKCKCEIDNCLSCSNISLSKELCITCNNEYKYNISLK